jgi:hypothetical protein
MYLLAAPQYCSSLSLLLLVPNSSLFLVPPSLFLVSNSSFLVPNCRSSLLVPPVQRHLGIGGGLLGPNPAAAEGEAGLCDSVDK